MGRPGRTGRVRTWFSTAGVGGAERCVQPKPHPDRHRARLDVQLRLVDAPGNVLVPAKASGLPKDSVANVSQVLTIDKDFLVELAGRIKGRLLSDVYSGLRLVLGL